MKIKHNMEMLDRVLRFLVAGLLIGLYFTHIINGATAIILLGLATIFIVTSFIAFCPLYLPFNIHTKTKKSE